MLCRYAEFHNAECHILFTIMQNVLMLSVIILSVVIPSVIMLSVIMLSVIMLSVIMLSVVMLGVVAPFKRSQIRPIQKDTFLTATPKFLRMIFFVTFL